MTVFSYELHAAICARIFWVMFECDYNSLFYLGWVQVGCVWATTAQDLRVVLYKNVLRPHLVCCRKLITPQQLYQYFYRQVWKMLKWVIHIMLGFHNLHFFFFFLNIYFFEHFKVSVLLESKGARGSIVEQVLPVCSRAALNDDTPTGLGGVEIGGHTSGGGGGGHHKGKERLSGKRKSTGAVRNTEITGTSLNSFPTCWRKRNTVL